MSKITRRTRRRRTLRTAFPAQSETRLSTIVEECINNETILLSPTKRRTVLPDDTAIEVPRRRGYKSYENESLRGRGRDLASKLRQQARGAGAGAGAGKRVVHPGLLAGVPEYRPRPVLTDNGIDFTNKDYNEKYMDMLMGPDPPILTELKIQTSAPFFDPARLKKNINLTMKLKSSNIATTLKEYVKLGAIAPTSSLVQIYLETQSNTEQKH